LKYIDVCLSSDDSGDVKCVMALYYSEAEICVVNSLVVEGLDLDPIGQMQLRRFCSNTVTADLVCVNIYLAESDMLNITPNQAVKVTGAVVSDLYDQFILIADVIARLTCCNASVKQAQVCSVNDSVYLPSSYRLRGSASPVLTVTGFVNGKRQFSTPYRIDTPQPITKNCHMVITSANPTALPN